MRLSPEKVAIALLDFGDLNEGNLAFRGRIENLGAVPLEVESEVEVADASSDRNVIFGPTKNAYVLMPGEKQELAVNFKAPASIFGDVTVRLKDAQGNQLLDHALPFVFSRDLRMEARYIPTPELLLVILNLGAGTIDKITDAAIKIVAVETGEEVLVNQIDDLSESTKRIEIDCEGVPVGSYEVLAEFKLGSEAVSLKYEMTKDPQPEWLNNTVGMSDEVLMPWTPLEIAGRTISCWGRDYTFGATGFPSQINILGQEFLTGPARVSAQVDGEIYQLNEGTFQPTEKKNTKISFKTVSNAGAVAIEGDTWIEFDGFVWNTINFSSAVPARLDELSVEIPLKKEFATLWWSGDAIFRVPVFESSILAPPQEVSTSAPSNFLRLGDEEHGIQFYYESFHGWNVTQTLIPGETDYVIRYDSRPTEPDKPRPLALGYMALPCKLRSPDYRRIDGVGWTRHDTVDKTTLEKTRDFVSSSPLRRQLELS
jgi:hypothetical protein|tara:strand:- start:1733 stop:3184 length:1452 start_codon:yes stop_codon:yes gene_type:complete